MRHSPDEESPATWTTQAQTATAAARRPSGTGDPEDIPAGDLPGQRALGSTNPEGLRNLQRQVPPCRFRRRAGGRERPVASAFPRGVAASDLQAPLHAAGGEAFPPAVHSGPPRHARRAHRPAILAVLVHAPNARPVEQADMERFEAPVEIEPQCGELAGLVVNHVLPRFLPHGATVLKPRDIRKAFHAEDLRFDLVRQGPLRPRSMGSHVEGEQFVNQH
eukprot:CAMPEP_0175229038 /NCGR_PEP_ID=MMETSP0093-20121207/24225_1 /TAXON_ID=311494 /ORGANISM="Alexandrium monilatum, Strain CCMP3105" /LENGTH=219 /DNA_ID=CAMNT_0016522827 /DNA_START=32 /DNA_END=691 /DNA_ORIENTATION=+